ncbi:MAG: GNAT family N-acetyltransferase [Deltaproteobacteria bacterium]|nr:GNAT family N-acetyltransferase [Deltaproteobacteria bacterium]
MKISVIAAKDLDDSHRAHWLALQQRNPALLSPYFCPEFTMAVAGVKAGVRVAILEERGEVVGYLPYEQEWGAGRPVGCPLSDHHGVIAAPDTVIEWPLLLRRTNLAYWKFDHLVAAQSPHEEERLAVSPGLDLSRGFQAWKAGRIAVGGRRVGELDRKARKLAREVGPLRFEAHVDDRAVLATVLRLKSEQCRRSGISDIFATPWTRALVDGLRHMDTPHFAGRLSALYAGDHLVAAHFGMRSDRAWHWWFPVYDHAHAKHSPGALLLLHTAEAAAVAGMQVLDLGKGDDVYKGSFADWSLPLVEGCVTRPALRTAARDARLTAVRWLKTSPLVQPLRPVWRSLRGFDRASARTADQISAKMTTE